MRSLRAALLFLATALVPGCVVAAHGGYGYGPGYARPYYGPPASYYRPAPPPRYHYGPPRGHYRGW